MSEVQRGFRRHSTTVDSQGQTLKYVVVSSSLTGHTINGPFDSLAFLLRQLSLLCYLPAAKGLQVAARLSNSVTIRLPVHALKQVLADLVPFRLLKKKGYR